MNSKVDEIFYKSGITAQGGWDELDDYQKECINKLVELTIRECAYQVKSVYKQGGGNYGETILKYFDLK